MRPTLGLSLLALVFAAALHAQPSSLTPQQLRCEYLSNPQGIDVVRPRLTWVFEPAGTQWYSIVPPKERGLKQTAYRILAAASAEKLNAGTGDLWDTGKVASDRSALIEYAGKPLASGDRVFWKVQVWDQAGRASSWSTPAMWSMGLLNAGDWSAKWIGLDETALYKRPGSPFHLIEKAHWISGGQAAKGGTFRASFSVPAGRTLSRAVCVMGADPSFELFVNGARAGAGGNFHFPEVIDISSFVKSGDNTVEVKTGEPKDGAALALISGIRIDFTSGDPVVFVTGDQWQFEGRAARDLGMYGAKPWGEVGFVEERALPARMLRKEFEASAKPARATVYVSGLGLFELSINGQKIGNEVLSPGLTDYDKRVQYVTYDVSRYVAAGRNAVGLMLGNGRFHGPRSDAPFGTRSFGNPKARLQLEIEYSDGRKQRVVTDESWKLTTAGPIRANNEYDGEEYDARMERKGWARAGFDDSGWQAAQVVAAPAGKMVARMAEPLRVVETLKPLSVHEIRPGVFVYDLGQNMVGWCRLHVNGPAGTEVRLRHSETLRNAELYVENLRTAQATDLYTLAGGAPETWEPRFTYHGFRYVEVTGYPGKPNLGAIEGRVVHDDMTRIASLETSNSLVNQLHHNIFWGVRGNYRSIPTDCPQRDERHGWMGDRSTVSRSESYLFDVAAFYTKWLTDIEDAQRADGAVPDVVPTYWTIYNDDVTWPSTFLLLPGMLYDQYGDLRPLAQHYPAMKRWVEHMRGAVKDGLLPRDTYADWCVPPESPRLIMSQDPARKTDGTLIATAYFCKMLGLMHRYANLLGKPDDAADYDRLADTMKAAFQKRYFRADTNQFDNGTQTSAILPLAFGLEPDHTRDAVLGHLVDKIHNESKDHVGVGLIGAQWLMRTLSDNGQHDLAWKIATQTTYPGWGYMIEHGATTVWELWNGDTSDPAMNSGNHVMQIGDLGVWLYEYLGGIQSDPEQPGFKHVVLRPRPVGDLRFARASHQSPYGTVRSAWKRENGRFTLDVTVPANTTATVYVPVKDGAAVTESGKPAGEAQGVKFVRTEAGAAVFNIEAGTYSFASAL